MTEPKLILPLYPVTDITIGPLPEHRMIVLRPDFLSPATQQQPEASGSKRADYTNQTSQRQQSDASPVPQQGRTYVLSRSQARYLQEQLQRSLQILDADVSLHPGSAPARPHPDASPDQ